MTHRVYVIWGGHRKGHSTRRKLPSLRKGEWAYGNGEPMERDTALAVVADLQARGHQARVVDLAGREVVIKPKVSHLRSRIEAQMFRAWARDQDAKKAASAPQLRLFDGGAA